jgi:hypothetical protein
VRYPSKLKVAMQDSKAKVQRAIIPFFMLPGIGESENGNL